MRAVEKTAGYQFTQQIYRSFSNFALEPPHFPDTLRKLLIDLRTSCVCCTRENAVIINTKYR